MLAMLKKVCKSGRKKTERKTVQLPGRQRLLHSPQSSSSLLTWFQSVHKKREMPRTTVITQDSSEPGVPKSPLTVNSFAALIDESEASSSAEDNDNDTDTDADKPATGSPPELVDPAGSIMSLASTAFGASPASSAPGSSGSSSSVPPGWSFADLSIRYRSEREEDRGQIGSGNDDDEEDFDSDFDAFYSDPRRRRRSAKPGSGGSAQPAARPIPDLRFEQSYRKAIAKADGVWWKIALITIRDQVVFTLLQGFVWQLALVGVKSWRLAMAHNGGQWGQTFVGRLSRWWAKVNNNKI